MKKLLVSRGERQIDKKRRVATGEVYLRSMCESQCRGHRTSLQSKLKKDWAYVPITTKSCMPERVSSLGVYVVLFSHVCFRGWGRRLKTIRFVGAEWGAQEWQSFATCQLQKCNQSLWLLVFAQSGCNVTDALLEFYDFDVHYLASFVILTIAEAYPF